MQLARVNPLCLAVVHFQFLQIVLGQESEPTRKRGGFIKWLEQKGGFASPNIQVTKDPVKGRFLRALDDIKAGEKLMVVPKSVSLSLTTASNECRRYAKAVLSGTATEMGDDGLKEALGSCSSCLGHRGAEGSLLLAFALLCERGRASASPWHLWILSLPEVSGASKIRPKLDAHVVIGEDLLSGAFAVASRVAEDVRSKFTANGDGFEPPKLEGLQIQWAWDTVKSRSFLINEDDSLVPGADLANHDDEATAEVKVTSSGETIIRASKDLRRRQEVSVNYVRGFNIEMPCYQWLFQYGFAPDSDLMLPVIEGIRVDLPPESEEDPEAPYNPRARVWLKENNCAEPHTVRLKEEIHPRLLTCIRALTIAIWERRFRHSDKRQMTDDHLLLAAKSVQAMKRADTDVSVPLKDGNVEQQAFIELRQLIEHLMEGKSMPKRDNFDSLEEHQWVLSCHYQQNRVVSHIGKLCTDAIWAIELPKLKKKQAAIQEEMRKASQSSLPQPEEEL